MKEVSPKRVAIKPDPIEDAGIIQETEISREQLQRKQNRGTVHMAGKDCMFAQAGDRVSFYRNAATMMTDSDDGEEYAVLNEEHILVKFIK